MKISKTKLFLAVFSSIFLSMGLTGITEAATYNWYFSQSGSDTGGDGSMGDPWKTLSKAKTKIDSVAINDIVNLYFKRGDTWSANTAAVSKETCPGINVGSTDPIVNIDAYVSGNKPIFDGLVSDFSSVPVENLATGPLSYNTFFMFNRHDCSVSNVEIQRVYGVAITTKDGDGFVLEDSTIHHFGAWGVGCNANFSAINLTAQRNLIYRGQELYHYSKRNTWEGAIRFANKGYKPSGCIARYNVVYDIYGYI